MRNFYKLFWLVVFSCCLSWTSYAVVVCMDHFKLTEENIVDEKSAPGFDPLMRDTRIFTFLSRGSKLSTLTVSPIVNTSTDLSGYAGGLSFNFSFVFLEGRDRFIKKLEANGFLDSGVSKTFLLAPGFSREWIGRTSYLSPRQRSGMNILPDAMEVWVATDTKDYIDEELISQLINEETLSFLGVSKLTQIFIRTDLMLMTREEAAKLVEPLIRANSSEHKMWIDYLTQLEAVSESDEGEDLLSMLGNIFEKDMPEFAMKLYERVSAEKIDLYKTGLKKVVQHHLRGEGRRSSRAAGLASAIHAVNKLSGTEISEEVQTALHQYCARLIGGEAGYKYGNNVDTLAAVLACLEDAKAQLANGRGPNLQPVVRVAEPPRSPEVVVRPVPAAAAEVVIVPPPPEPVASPAAIEPDSPVPGEQAAHRSGKKGRGKKNQG